MYTYDDYLKKKAEYGFGADQISDADDRLAQMNLDAGMALLGYKNDWINATNDSQRAFSHAGAEDIRSRYGNYTGGESGGSFVPTGTAAYDDPWETAVQAQIKNMENRKFEWSPETDPMVKYYEDAYRREGERAMKDTLGAVAATTGGIPSSYATAAAAQQNNYYMQQLTDKYPELYQQAYDNFMKEFERDYQMLDVYSKQSDTEYDRWFDKQELDRQARQDAAAAEQQAFDNNLRLEELALNQQQLAILKDEFELSLQKFDHEKQVAIKDDAYRWAALIQEGKIAEAEQEYRNSALALDEKKAAWDYAVNTAKIKEDARQFDLTQEQHMTDAYNDVLRAIIGAEGNLADLAALEALGFDTTAMRDQVIEAMQKQGEGETADETVEGVTGGESVVRKPTEPSGYDLNASVIDQLAEDAPGYRAKADAEAAAKNAQNENDYGKKYASYLAGGEMSKDDKKNLDYTLDSWISTYRSGGNLTDEARAVVERYNSESVMQDLFNKYNSGKYILPTEEKLMKAYVEDAYNRYKLNQKISATEKAVLDVWLGGKKTKIGKYW